MEVKSNIRHRRQERVKQIRSQLPPVHDSYWARTPTTYYGEGDGRTTDYSPEQDKPINLQDPEWVWKERQRQMFKHQTSDRLRKNRFGTRSIISLLLFALIWGMFQLETEWARKGQAYFTAVFTDSIQFSKMAAWYEKTFKGVPSFIPAFDDRSKWSPIEKASGTLSQSFTAPAQGHIMIPYTEKTEGILLETSLDSPIKTIRTGRVVSAGLRDDTGLTVVVQHADLYQSVYGLLSEIYVSKNDWLEGGEPVGRASSDASEKKGKLYFSVSRNNEYINPADVVKFD